MSRRRGKQTGKSPAPPLHPLPAAPRPARPGGAPAQAQASAWRRALAGVLRWPLRTQALVKQANTWLRGRHPILSDALHRMVVADVVDRAAALALFCVLAAVPTLFVGLSALGFVLGAVDEAGDVTGVDFAFRSRSLMRVAAWLEGALPGVAWQPAEFAHALVRDRTQNGIVGTIFAVSLGLTVFTRIDAAVRAVFDKPARSALRAAGFFSGFVLLAALLAVVATIAAPLSEWALRVASRSMKQASLGIVDIDAVALAVAASQVLPVAITFYALVRWSVGDIGKRRLGVVAVGFGALWFLGQRVFTVYVKNVVHMDAVYGALTGVVALIMWLFYANIAFLVAVALLAAWERCRTTPHRSGDRTSPRHPPHAR
ncbi:MAG: hypothetical protein EXR79_01390 [Myxococcales bacterium]|nr:hypothetical protein [Myxococcales bacterium]